MYSIIYALIAIIVAPSVGVWLYREYDAYERQDYILAIAAGALWPITIALCVLLNGLDMFKRLCIYISDCMDEAEAKRLEKEASKSKEP